MVGSARVVEKDFQEGIGVGSALLRMVVRWKKYETDAFRDDFPRLSQICHKSTMTTHKINHMIHKSYDFMFFTNQSVDRTTYKILDTLYLSQIALPIQTPLTCQINSTHIGNTLDTGHGSQLIQRGHG